MKSLKNLSLKEIGVIVRNYLGLHKKIFYSLAIFLVVICVIFYGAKIYLALNLLVGNDALVRLTSSERNLFLSNGESFEVEFSTYVSANPSCKSVCNYTMRDLFSGEVIDRNSFNTIISNPTSKSYTFYAPDKGEGQKLYRFSVSCFSRKSTFCKTEGNLVEKSIIVSLNYNLSDEQSRLRIRAIDNLNDSIDKYNSLENLYLENLYLYDILSDKILIDKFSLSNLSSIKMDMNKSFEYFAGYDYEDVLSFVVNFSDEEIEKDNVFLRAMVDKYNEFVTLSKEEINLLNELTLEKNMSALDWENISLVIQEYYVFLENLNYSFDVDDKIREVEDFLARTNRIDFELDRFSVGNFVFNEVNFSVPKSLVINFSSNYTSKMFIPEEKLICNYDGVRKSCCDLECKSYDDGYPVILIHGHSFNSGISAEKSLGDLQDIRMKLFSDGFLDGGDLILRGEGDVGTFARTREQVVFSVSYYFDIYQSEDDVVLLETKSDNLDSYALRLNEIIEEVKAETGRDKVIIVAHSMGGLVSRKYLRVFGEENVDRLIMIGTPNHGIDGLVLSTCPILGEDKHCNDMDKDSLFLNKLNYGKVPEIVVKNIIGIGCDTDGADGDGVVKNSSAYLDWADNYYVNGTCEGVEYLHNKMVHPEKVLDVYDLVRGFLD